jgi:hypothetical protein
VNLSGFLQGDRRSPLRWHQVPLACEPTSEGWRSIAYFQLRAREFLANVDDLGLRGRRSLALKLDGEKAKAFTDAYPGRHRAKSLYLDFRHFLADKEPSKLQKVINVVRRNAPARDPIQEFIGSLKEEFTASQTMDVPIGGRQLQVGKLIDVWFNTEFFHAGKYDQVHERQRWLGVLEEDSAHQLMFWTIVDSAHHIKCLYACVKDLKQHGMRDLNCPDMRIIRRTI